jgi:DHA2 family multidrug resistance protein
MGLITFFRSQANSDMNYFSIARWLLVQGFGMPMFFVPLTGIALASVNVEETAAAAGLMSFCRTLSGAIATSMVTTTWANNASRNHADMAGTLNGAQDRIDALVAGGFGPEQARGTLDQLVQNQSVVLATNQIFLFMAAMFVVAACVVWLAPRPTRVADTSAAH